LSAVKIMGIKGGRWVIGGAALGVLALVAVILLTREAIAPAAASTTPAATPIGTRLEATGAAPTVSPTATQPITAQPTASVVGASATPRPLEAQAFGQLPLLAMPGDSGIGPRYALSYTRAGHFDGLPTSANVYRLTWPRFTADRVRDLAARLGLSGAITTLGPGAFEVSDAAGSRLFVAHGRVFYTRGGQRPPRLTIDSAGATEQARRWLISRGLLPADAGPARGQVLSESALVVVTFLPAAPQPLITPEPAIIVTLDGAGEVFQLDSYWPAATEPSPYPLSTPAAAWEAIERGDAFVDVGLLPPSGAAQRLTGQARLSQVTLGYALAAGVDAEAAAYLEPVYIFTGAVQLDGQTTPTALSVYVPALRDYPWPHG
jgi:hypothetical protein